MAGRSITIRDVPEHVHAELAARAARRSQSLQEFLIGELRNVAEHPPTADVVARARRRAHDSGVHLEVQQILDARDADRR